jgi:NAD(P)-dependent dehydrogenase (short-subunit alcohol dehydrogenase family)
MSIRNLQNQRVVLLGGTSGIGLATAQAVRAAGGAVVLVSSRPPSLANALAQLGDRAEGHAVDLTDEAAVKRLFEGLGAFDHLVYTAGDSLPMDPLAETGMGALRKAFDVRVFGAMAAVRHATPHLRPGGSVVLTGGVASLRPKKGWTVAASLCGAMDAFTRALAVELAPLRVNLVSPGFVRTPLWGHIPEAQREAMYRDVGAALPVGRVGEPRDIAQTYLYLLTNPYATGQVVVVDGGGVLV